MDPNSQNQGWGGGIGTNPQNVLQAENYIRQNSGTYSIDQIKEVLKSSGYGEADINQAVVNVFPPVPGQPGDFNQVGYQGQPQAMTTGNVSMDIGSLLSSSFEFYKVNLVKLAIICVIGILAILPFVFKATYDLFNLIFTGTGFDVVTLALLFLGLIGVMLSNMATTNYIVQVSRGESFGVIEAYGRVMPFFFSYLLLVILTFVLVGLGAIAIVIPGIIIAIYLVFAPFTFFDEGFRGLSAIKRSYELVKGDGLSVFLYILMALVAMFLVWLVTGILIRYIGVLGLILNMIIVSLMVSFLLIFTFQLYRAVKFKKTGTA